MGCLNSSNTLSWRHGDLALAICSDSKSPSRFWRRFWSSSGSFCKALHRMALEKRQKTPLGRRFFQMELWPHLGQSLASILHCLHQITLESENHSVLETGNCWIFLEKSMLAGCRTLPRLFQQNGFCSVLSRRYSLSFCSQTALWSLRRNPIHPQPRPTQLEKKTDVALLWALGCPSWAWTQQALEHLEMECL